MDSTWVRQELECVKVELQRLNHLKDYQPSMQFFTNELRAIEQIQAATTNGTWQEQEARENIWWLASTLRNYDQAWSGYHGKIRQAAHQAGAVCRVMQGTRSEWMSKDWYVPYNCEV